VKDFVGESPIVAHAYKNERDFLDYEFARAKVIQWGESAYAEGPVHLHAGPVRAAFPRRQ
jgi:DNA polymerase-3 subunit epsilon